MSNPNRGQLWILGAEVATIGVLAMLNSRNAIVLLIVLWFVFLTIHSSEVGQVLNRLGAGQTNA